MLAHTIHNFNEDSLNRQYGFVKSSYNGIPVMFNPNLAGGVHFFKQRFPKKKLVIHHTAGAIWGDIPTLITPSKVSTAFVISPKGTIYMLFNPWNWAFHLGRTALGGNGKQSQESIGIEISNFGFLVRRGDTLYTYMGRPYCKINETQFYIKIDKPWKNYEYFCRYTDEQYEALKTLKDKLCSLYRIPDVLFPEIHTTNNSNVINFQGITTHNNFRQDKFDVSPIFDWSRLFDNEQDLLTNI